MRIIGELPHPTMKITVFKMGDKLSIKFEKHLLEQIYKFREGSSSLETFEDVVKAFSDATLSRVESILDNMDTIRFDCLQSMNPAVEDDFPDII